MRSSTRSSKRKPGRAKQGEVLVPSDDLVSAARKKLREFDALDTRELLAEGLAASNNQNLDEAFATAYTNHVQKQIKELLRALKCDPKNPWADGFLKLVQIHHGVGRLRHRMPRGSGAASWTPEANFVLLREVQRLTAMGLSQRKALQQLAQDRSYHQVFPYGEHRIVTRPAGAASLRARVDALRQQYYRLLKASNESGWAATLGISSKYEGFLTDWRFQRPPASDIEIDGRWPARMSPAR